MTNVTILGPTPLRQSITTGYIVTGEGHHAVPFALWDEIGFSYDAMKYLDGKPGDGGPDGSTAGALFAAPEHGWSSAHYRYNHEVRIEWERFLQTSAGKKLRPVGGQYGTDAAEAFLKHVRSGKNRYIAGFLAHVGEGPADLARWFSITGSKFAIPSFKTSFFKTATKRIGKSLPYINFLLGAVTYATALDDARAANDSEAMAQLEALSDAIVPLPFTQQDIRNQDAAARAYFAGKEKALTNQRFGDLLDSP